MTERKSLELKDRVINNIARRLSMDYTIYEFLISVRHELSMVLDVKNLSVFSYHDGKIVLPELVHFANNSKETMSGDVVLISQSEPIGNLIKQKKIVLFSEDELNSINKKFNRNKKGRTPTSIVGVPIMEDKNLLGLLILQSFESDKIYNERDLEFLTIVGAQLGSFISRKQTENALKRSEERNRALTQGNPDVIFRLDKEGFIKDFHAAPGELILPPRTFKDANITDVLSPEQGVECLALIQSAIKSGDVKILYHDIWHKNVHYYFEGRIVKNGDDEVLKIVRNITEQKKAEILKDVLYNIAFKSNSSLTTTHELCEFIRQQMGQLMDVSNFYISQLTNSDMLSFIFLTDGDDHPESPYTRRAGNGLSEYIIRTGESLLLRGKDVIKFQKEKKLTIYGEPAKSWIGAPLILSHKVVGAIVCQSRTNKNAYNKSHLAILTEIGNQIGLLIERKKAEEDRNSFAQIFNNSLSEIFIFDSETLKFNYVNKGGQVNLGYTQEEIFELTPFDLCQDISPTTFGEILAPLKSGEIPVKLFESVHTRKDGTSYPIEVSLQYCTFKGHTVFAAMILDISQRKKDELKTSQSLSDLQLIDQINQASIKNASFKELVHEILDIHHKIIPISGGRFYLFDEDTAQLEFVDEWLEHDLIRQLEEKSGLQLEKVVPSISKNSSFYKAIEERKMLVFQDENSIRKIMKEREQDKLMKKIFALPKGLANIQTFLIIPYVFENKIFGLMTLTSKQKISENRIDRIQLFNNQIIAALAKTKVEQEIAEQKKFNEEVLNNIPADIVVFDKNHNYLYINPEAIKSEETRNWLIGKNNFDYAKFKGISDSDAKKRNELFNKAIETQADVEFVDMHLTPDGSMKYMLRKYHPYFENSNLKQVIGYGVDITKMIEAEKAMGEFAKQLELTVQRRTRDLTRSQEKLQNALEKEKHLGELKSRFVTTASHQFRTPMSIIQSNSDLLAMLTENSNLELKPKLEKAVDRIQREIKRMTNLMDDILILGKITAGKVSALQFQPTDLLLFCKELIEGYNEIQTTDRSIDIEFTGRRRKVSMDQKLMSHALSNLISNALKYSTVGNPKIRLEYKKDEVKILVIDQGIGIPQKEMSELFEPFHRAENVGNISGTGLGLTIVKEYVELNGGEISVVSELNKGTTFTLTFPGNKKRIILNT